MKRVNIKKDGDSWQMWGFSLFGGDRHQVLGRVVNRLKLRELGLRGGRWKGRPMWIATVNPEFVMEAVKDSSFRKILCNKTDLNVMDGIGLIWAKEVLRPNEKFSAKGGLRLASQVPNYKKQTIIKRLFLGLRVGIEIFLGKHREKVVTGSDLMLEMCRLAKRKNYRVFFLGGWGNRAEKTARNLQFSNLNLQTGWSSGEPEVKNAEVLRKINKFKPDILLVAYGMKKQEKWIEKNLNRLDVGVVMGVGRSFDYYSGDLKRAPKIWRSKGLEWLYSLIKEPKRWRRQLVLPKFVWRVIFGDRRGRIYATRTLEK